MDGWIVTFYLQNLSSQPIYTFGFKTPDPEYFFLTRFAQLQNSETCQWLYSNGQENYLWAEPKYIAKVDAKFLIEPSNSFEWKHSFGSIINSPRRLKTYVAFEGQEEPCVIYSEPFLLRDKGSFTDVEVVIANKVCYPKK